MSSEIEAVIQIVCGCGLGTSVAYNTRLSVLNANLVTDNEEVDNRLSNTGSPLTGPFVAQTDQSSVRRYISFPFSSRFGLLLMVPFDLRQKFVPGFSFIFPGERRKGTWHGRILGFGRAKPLFQCDT
jgi:hypothetical protein